MKRFLQNKYLAKIIAVIFFCFIVFSAEVMAYFLTPPNNRLERILVVLEQDAELFWKQKSNLNTVFEEVLIKTNTIGLRNQEVRQEKRNNAFRIICLGASPTFGWGVNKEQVYSSQLQRLLRQNYSQQKEIEVINAGEIGYSSHQGLRFFKEKIIRLDPDLITVPYVINDVDKHRFYRSNGKGDRELNDKNHILVLVENFLDKSNIVRILRKGMLRFQSGAIQYFGKSGANRYLETRRVSLEDYAKNLKEIVRVARQNGIEVVFVKMPVNLPAPEPVLAGLHTQAERHINMALASAELNQYEDAIEALKKAIMLNPYSGKAYYYIGKYCEKLNKPEDARKYFKKTLKMELFECGQLGKVYNKIMQKVASEENVFLVDIVSALDEYQKKDNAPLFLDERNDSIHPSAVGHAVIGRAIYKVLIDNSLIE